MTTFNRLNKMLDLYKNAKTKEDWEFLNTLIFKSFTIDEIEIIKDDIVAIEKRRFMSK